ncbi:MAG: transglycosylase SLT domain-containing protein [Proteobacteria bacterium]|nr:transglycosylase SLT domain-containing protein [Pseudomonadota bacterium]
MKKYFFLFFIFILLVPNGRALGQPDTEIPAATLPSLISATRIEGPLGFCGEKVPLEIPEVRERLEKEMLLILWNRPQVILWLKRANRYFPYIENTLAQHNLPEDLKYVAVIESALLPHAGSTKGAVGFWQFIRSTGRHYDLTINSNIDERRNLFASTKAAANYFKDLHALFGSWALAAAAYNMGEDRLQKEMESQKVDNYYHSHLYLETQRYIFKIIAAKLIFSDPARYGFHLQPQDLYPPLSFDRVKVTAQSNTPLYLVAQASGTYFKAIKDLNPEIRGHQLTKGTHIIAVPKGSGPEFHDSFATLVKQWRKEYKMHVYIVKKGDNLTAIAERFHVPLPALMAWNDLSPSRFIHPGEQLVIYR